MVAMLYRPACSYPLVAGLLSLLLSAFGCGTTFVVENETSPVSSSADGGCPSGGSTIGASFPAVYTTLAAHQDWLISNLDGTPSPNDPPPDTIVVVLGDNVSCDDPAHLVPPPNDDEPWDCASWAWRVELVIPPSVQHIGSYMDVTFEFSLVNDGIQYCDGGLGTFAACVTIEEIASAALRLRVDGFRYTPGGTDYPIENLPDLNGEHVPIQCQ
jgi:hypothetical protein